MSQVSACYSSKSSSQLHQVLLPLSPLFTHASIAIIISNVEVNGGDNVFVRCLSVCLCLSLHNRPVNQTSLKQLKLWTSNLPCMFPGTVQTRPLKNFSKGGRDPQNFGALNANSFKSVKARNFKFDVHVSRDSLDTTP